MGVNSHIPANITTDFLGNNRFTDGNGNGDTLPDLGAFEHSKQLQSTATICPGDTVLLGSQVIHAPGVYSDTVSGIGSCDSIIQLTVIALPTDSGFVTANICEGDVFTYQGQNFSTPGKHYVTAPSSGDCDSIIEINLFVAPIDTVTLADTTVFEGQGALFFQTTIDSSGLYVHVTPSSQGCDSVIRQNITFLEVDSIVHAAFCSGTSFSFQGNNLTAPGDYFFIQTDSSVIRLMLAEQGGDTTDLGNVFFSMGTTHNFFGTNLNTPGTYYHTMTASTGCDSVLKINLYYRKYVTESGSGAQNGNSWATAYSASQLQTAIDNIATNGGGQVWVAKGIYKRGNLRHQNFFLRTGVELIGGFVGNETDTTQRVSYKLNEINQTVLSADIGVVGDSTDNAYNVIVQNTSGYALIDGFVIRDAQGIGFSAEGAGVVMRPGSVLRNSVIYKNYGAFKGGGLFADQATVEYCSFIENRANNYGGAALIRNSTVRHCYFENNSSSNGGGALQIEFDHTLIDSCTFQGNHLNNYGWGGAIAFDGTVDTAVVQYSTFNNNTAVLGGAVHNLNTASEVLYKYCVFTNNHAPDFVGPNSTQQGTGGAMRIVNNRAVHCTFSNNSATRGGAVWVGADGVIDSCTFNNNTASARGGAIYGWDNGQIRNSVINGGSSPNGGGAFLEGTSVLEHSIIQNAQSPLGGGVYVESDAVVRYSTLRFNNSNAGGGVLLQNGGMVFDCDIYGNTASNGGGASTRSNGGPIINSRIYNNSSNSNGGGIFLNLSNTQGGEVINSNVYNNHAGLDGGGIHFNFGGRAINTNISRNSANRNGGGVFLNFRGNVRNSIIWGNSTQVATSSSGTALSIDTTAIQGGYSGNAAGNLITPLDTNNNGLSASNYIRFNHPTTFAGLPANASDSTQLQQVDWSLLCGSAAIDAGNNLTVPDTISLDKVGNNRFIAVGAGQPIVDLGPIEANFTYNSSEILCVGDSFVLGQQIITEPGIYTLNTTSTLGCDSTLIVAVNFLPTDTFHIQVTACQNSGYVFDQDTLFVPGVYYASFESPNFCDSIVELNLSVVTSYTSQSQATICFGDTFVFRGQTLTQTGLYRDTLLAINGCDSIISLQLNVQAPDTTQLFLSGCGSLTFDGVTYTTPGTHLLQYPSATACDSFVELTVAIVQNFQDTLIISACESYEYNNQIYTTSGLYSHSFISSQNCDSTVVLDLSIWQPDSSSLAISACGSYDFNGQLLTQSGSYTDTLSTVNGCDSIVTLQLNILQTTSASTTITACTNYNFNGQVLTQSGNYTDTLMAANGCDSIVQLALTILQPASFNLNISSCVNYNFNGVLLSQSGNYTDTLVAANGCDSIVQLSLTILQPITTNLTISSCEEYNFNGILLTQSGNYTDTLTATNGCDSIINLSLTIEQPTQSNVTINACGDYNFNGILLTQSGSYTDTLTGANGCDSIVTLQLTIQTIDRSVTNNDPTLIAQAVGVAYQWYDCTGDSILSNQTAQSFTATRNGTYAVILTDGACTDTSDCYLVNTIGLWVGNLDQLQLYPNPTQGQITLSGDDLLGASIRLLDMRGSVLHLATNIETPQWQRDLSTLAAGTYMLEVIRGNARKVFMIVRI